MKMHPQRLKGPDRTALHRDTTCPTPDLLLAAHPVKICCLFLICLIFIVPSAFAQDAPLGSKPGKTDAHRSKQIDKPRGKGAEPGTSFVRVDSGCFGAGHNLRLSWKMSPDHADARVSVTLRIPGDDLLRLDDLAPKGERSLALTPASTGLVTLDVTFADDTTHASARARLALPYPDTGRTAVETSADEAGLSGTIKAEIVECPKTGDPVGTVLTAREAERIAEESLQLMLREEAIADARDSLMVFGHGTAGSPSTNPFEGPQIITSNEPPFDAWKMATCIEREMYDRNVMGYGYAIVVNKQLARAGSGGWARSPFESESGSIEFGTNTPAQIASVSKPITAMAIMKLVQDGDLDLDDAFYPLVQSEYPTAGVGVAGITIRQLLQHNSGLLPRYCGKTAESIAADVTGSGGYSNINYCVLREVVEHVSGKTYVDFVQSELLTPAGIGGMSCQPGSANPTLHYTDADDQNAGTPFSDYTDRCGAYGWYASAVDLGRLMAHYRNNTTLSQSIAQQMRTDCNGIRCLGFRTRNTSEGTAYGHSGAWTINGNSARAGMGYFPRGIDAALVMNSSADGGSGFAILRKAYNRAFRGGCTPPPEPPGPPSCPDTGCGTAVNGLCAKAGEYPDGTLTPSGFNPFIRQNHPDGAAAYNLYCEDHPELLDHAPDAPHAELVCARATLSSGTHNVCKACGVDGKFWPGCECDPNQVDSCGPGLTCFGASGYGNGSTSFSSGKCWSEQDGPPIWECEADCTAIYGGWGYCYHGALPWEGAGTPICASNHCELGGRVCAEQGLFCNVDSGDCEVECNGTLHNPAQGLFSCQGRGYGDEFACNLDSSRCFIGGVPHP